MADEEEHSKQPQTIQSQELKTVTRRLGRDERPPPEGLKDRDVIAARRMKLIEGGYLPIPAKEKRTLLEGWSELTEVTEAMVEGWSRSMANHPSDGLMGRTTPGLDLDIKSTMAAERLERHIWGKYSSRGRILVRVGNAPKRLLPFRTDQPFDKITVNLIAPDGSMGQKIEFLASGQMFIAFGIHPDTGMAYQWYGGAPGEVRWQDLPAITEEEARELVDELVEILLEEFGYSLPERTRGPGRPNGSTSSDWDELVDNIRSGTELHASIRDMAAKLVGHRVPCDAAVRFLEDLMDECRSEHDERWQKRRDDIPRMVETAQEKFAPRGITIEKFLGFLLMSNYIYVPTGELWPAAGVNAKIPPVPELDRDGRPAFNEDGKLKKIKASDWLSRHQSVNQMTWDPGRPKVVKDEAVVIGGWIPEEGSACFNHYIPALPVPGGVPRRARRWLKHWLKIYSKEEVKHIVRWLAWHVQHPGRKVNHALVLGGNQGIGKDLGLVPVRRAVGEWNFVDVSPTIVMGRFTGFKKAVILRVSEMRDLGDRDRFAFHNHMKTMEAAPPEVLQVDEKNTKEYWVVNCMGVLYTANEQDSLYLPEDDRRHYVAWSTISRGDLPEDYHAGLGQWYQDGGIAHVVAYLKQLDLTGFDPKAPPAQTEAFWQIVTLNRAAENDDLANLIDMIGEWGVREVDGRQEKFLVARPAAFTLDQLRERARGQMLQFGTDLFEWLTDRRNFRRIPHILGECGYVTVRNRGRKDGLWTVAGKQQSIYVKSILSPRDRSLAAETLEKALRGR